MELQGEKVHVHTLRPYGLRAYRLIPHGAALDSQLERRSDRASLELAKQELDSHSDGALALCDVCEVSSGGHPHRELQSRSDHSHLGLLQAERAVHVEVGQQRAGNHEWNRGRSQTHP